MHLNWHISDTRSLIAFATVRMHGMEWKAPATLPRYTGDVLGAAEVIVEISTLTVIASLSTG